MAKGDSSDMKRAQEQTYDRFRSHGAPKEFAQDQAARARDRLEKRHDEGKGVGEAKKDSSRQK